MKSSHWKQDGVNLVYSPPVGPLSFFGIIWILLGAAPAIFYVLDFPVKVNGRAATPENLTKFFLLASMVGIPFISYVKRISISPTSMKLKKSWGFFIRM